MDDLYYGDQQCHCGQHHFTNSIRFDADVLSMFMKKVYDGFDTDSQIEPAAWHEVVRIINEGTVEGLSQSPVPPTHDELFYRELRHSNEVFAAFKVHTMGNEMAAKLYDADGNLKPFDKWARDVSSIASHQVGSWLQTEYDTAVIRAHAAADWKEFERNRDIMPNLRWMPTTSPEPESSHRQYWQMGLTLPIDDPFWNDHHPGDRWNCKCSLEATDDPVTVPEGFPEGEQPKPQRGLENNPGKDGHIFNDTHPYFPESCSKCPVRGASGFTNKLHGVNETSHSPVRGASGFTNKLKSIFENRKKDCYNCPYINGCLYGSEKSEIKDIKKEARERFQGTSLRHPKLDKDIKISRRSIDEWTNQPHSHKAEKNRMLLHIDQVMNDAKYLGRGDDKSTKEGHKFIHLFETSIQGDKSWIIVKEFTDGNCLLYSISEGADILKALK